MMQLQLWISYLRTDADALDSYKRMLIDLELLLLRELKDSPGKEEFVRGQLACHDKLLMMLNNQLSYLNKMSSLQKERDDAMVEEERTGRRHRKEARA